MTEKSPFNLTVEELERGVRVPREEQVESLAPVHEVAPDPRGPEPDLGWFAAGG